MSSPRQYRGLRVDNGEWVYGYYIYRNCVNNDTHYIAIRAGLYHQVIPETVGQYTGKKDKNGVEIYEDDICRNGDYEMDAHAWNYRIEVIGWDNCNAAWLGWNPNENGMSCEIIGNFHTTPQLLENK